MKCFVATDHNDLKQAFELRHVVFVDEQKVPKELEVDEFDQQAIHLVAKENDKVVGTGRLVIENNKGRIGRLAVRAEFRGRGIGKAIMLRMEKEARLKGLSELYFHAQVHALGFYEKLGYISRGEKFAEAGIDHIEMFKNLLTVL